MRGTVFLAPVSSAARIFTACRPPQSRVLRALRREDLSTADYDVLSERILSSAAEPLGKDELGEITGVKGMALTTVVNCLRYEGRMVSVAGDSLKLGPLRYVATSPWVPGGLDAGDPTDALCWLAGAYLRGYGPARVDDFAWWAGVTKRLARAALGAQETVDLGDGLLLPAGDDRAFAAAGPLRGTVDLLPKWDAYTMGHAPDGRSRFVHPDVQQLVYTPIGPGLPGDGNPVVLVEGRATATWTFTVKEGPAVQPFDTFGPKLRRRVDEEIDGVAGLLSR